MTTPIVVPVTPQAQPGADGPIYEAKLGDPQLDAIAAATKERMKGSMGVDEIRIDAPLRRAIREPAVDVDEEPFIGPTMPGIAAPPPTQHRYTIDVPSLAEGSVLKLGAPDTGRNLPDPGISGRTLTHVHLHATQVPTMLTLGEPTKVVLGDAAPQGTDDVLSKSRGFAAVTEGTAWIDAKEQLALVTRTGEASMRAIEGDLRLQADATNVELAAGQKVVIGAGDSVKIVATSGTDAQINGYQKPFGKSFFDGSWAFGSKEIMAAADVYTSVASLFKAFDEQESDYKKGNVSKEQTATDFAKNFVDAGKIVSTLVRYALGHSLGGQVKISAETFASITGGLAASVFGNLSASLTSPLSASVVGGTASMKGMAWSSVWAGLGVSIRTVRGKASLKSEQGKASVSGKLGVSVTSEKTVSIGGDEAAELKSLKVARVAALGGVDVVAGEGAGMGLLAEKSEMWVGSVGNPEKLDSVARNANLGMKISRDDGVQVLADESSLALTKAHFELKTKAIKMNGKTLDLDGDVIRLG